jgi:hypothetical protein
MYTFLGLLMDGPASLAAALIGLRIAPHFDKPYLASSLTDFWSRRWNLTAGNALRFMVRASCAIVFLLDEMTFRMWRFAGVSFGHHAALM